MNAAALGKLKQHLHEGRVHAGAAFEASRGAQTARGQEVARLIAEAESRLCEAGYVLENGTSLPTRSSRFPQRAKRAAR